MKAVMIACALLWSAIALAQTQDAPPPDELTSFTARQWSMADALCRRDMAPVLAQLAKAQADLTAANKQIDDLKKAAAAKDEPKGQN